MNPARAAAPGEGRSDVPETGSAGAQEARRDLAGRVRSVSKRRTGVDGTAFPATIESRKAEDASAPTSVTTRLASFGIGDLKPLGLTSGISGERSESAACRG